MEFEISIYAMYIIYIYIYIYMHIYIYIYIQLLYLRLPDLTLKRSCKYKRKEK